MIRRDSHDEPGLPRGFRVWDGPGCAGTRALLAVSVAIAAAGCASSTAGDATGPSRGPQPASPSRAAVASSRSWVFGHSRDGVPLVAVERRTAGSARRVLVIGCIHGDEVAGVQIVAVLGRQRLTQPADLVLVKTVNPDGQRLHRRQNANGVDLNRNFPYRWRPLGVRGDQQYSGPKPLSEPEARAVVALIRALRPVVTVWFHEPVDVVDESGGDVSVEHEFASLVGQRLRRLSRYPGSVASWQDTTFPGTTAFVDELPRGGPADISSWVRAVESLSYRRG